MSIKTLQHDDKWLSGFGGAWNTSWKEGDTVTIEVEQKGEYLNFFKPDPMEDLLKRIEALEHAVFEGSERPSATNNEIDPDAIPF